MSQSLRLFLVVPVREMKFDSIDVFRRKYYLFTDIDSLKQIILAMAWYWLKFLKHDYETVD